MHIKTPEFYWGIRYNLGILIYYPNSPESMIDLSRKKDHYFDDDYSPYLIDHDKYGILRIPENRTL